MCLTKLLALISNLKFGNSWCKSLKLNNYQTLATHFLCLRKKTINFSVLVFPAQYQTTSRCQHRGSFYSKLNVGLNVKINELLENELTLKELK